MQFIAPIAKYFCQGDGLDIGGGKWPLEGAISVDISMGKNIELFFPDGKYDYIFSSHCLEHLVNPIAALELWKNRIHHGGVLFLYLPHPDMEYWRPENNRKHLHSWYPDQMVDILSTLGFKDIICSQRDMMWSFSVVGFVS